MWRFPDSRPSVTNPNAQSDAADLHGERTRIRVVAGPGHEDDDHSADSFGHRFRRHTDSHF
jgi:hypothetical protein